MGARVSRLVSAVAAGGVLSGALLFGGGVAAAAPAAPSGSTIAATCGQQVTARPGDKVAVRTPLGTSFTVPVVSGMAPVVGQLVDGLLCQVQVTVVAPLQTAAAQAQQQVQAQVLAPAAGAVAGATAPRSAAPKAAATTAPKAAAAPKPAPAPAPAPAAAPAAPLMTPQAQAAAAPAFAPAFGQLPASFLKGAAPAAPAGLRSYDAGALFGSAFPGLGAGAPAYLGYDPASAVTTASQVQALPVDGLSRGVGVPVMLAVLALAGVAAFAVRHAVLGRTRSARAALAGATADTATGAGPTGDDDAQDAELTEATELRAPATRDAVPDASEVTVVTEQDAERTELVGTGAR